MRGFLLLSLALAFPAFAGTKEALQYSNRTGGCALIIWQNGQTRLEDYRRGGAPEKKEYVYSITKSLAALGTFSAVGKGLVKFDEKAARSIPAWQKDPRKNRITIRELLSQTSGLASGFDALYAASLRDKKKVISRLPAISPPGKSFLYGPSHYEALEVVLARKLGRSPLPLIENSVLGPLGIRSERWRKDTAGDPYFSAGARLSARDLLKVGHLVRRKGWNWIFPLVPSSSITQASTGSGANSMYGFGLWLNANARQKNTMERDVEEAISQSLSPALWSRSCLSRSAPADLVAMVGSRGQRVYISRSQNLVIVRLGRDYGFRDPDFLRAFFAR